MTRISRLHPTPSPRPAALAALALALSAGAWAQGEAPAPSPAPSPAPTPAPAPASQQVEINAPRAASDESRRQSTAAKIVIGREEIATFGDSTVGEVLRRLPGITIGGTPGRGGAPRMRGLGAGYTQILLDGERVPAGFSIDSLSPEQIERIEILRAPTAETGARAIGGTINIITREGFTKRLNDLSLTLGRENGRWQPQLAWTRNDTLGDMIYNLSLSLFNNDRDSDSTSTTRIAALPSDLPVQADKLLQSHSEDQRSGLHLSSRLQWRNDSLGSLTLMPFIVYSNNEGQRRLSLSSPQNEYDHAEVLSYGHFAMARLGAQWVTRLGDGTRLELGGNGGSGRGRFRTLRDEFDAADVRTLNSDDLTAGVESSLSLRMKASKLLDNDHSLVGGAEADGGTRHEDRTYLLNGKAPVGFQNSGDSFRARTLRLAAYAQDEWKLSPQWAVQLGLRWEGMHTVGSGGTAAEESNRSSVTTPMLHAVWKFAPESRDQIRMSLTRSYRPPNLQSLIGAPRLAVGDRNSQLTPDSAGNAQLRPELATSLEVGLERYLAGGGVLSANLFHKDITDLIRTTTIEESVSWSRDLRWVSRPKNVGGAVTQGIELEAKFRLNQWLESAPAVELRSNLSLFRSRVQGVPGPDNRLDEQAAGTLNLGGDYRFRGGWPLTLGGNLNFTPAYRTQIADKEYRTQGLKRVLDAYAVWAFDPNTKLRLSFSNLAPLDTASSRTVDTDNERQTGSTVARSYLNWQLKLELKL